MKFVENNLTERQGMRLTCLPDVLNPDVGTRREEKPLYGHEQEARNVRCDRHANEEYGERLYVTI